MAELSVGLLDPGQLLQAYPLVRSITHVTQERWLTFARELSDAGGGIIGATGPDGCLHGLAAFRQYGTLRHGLSLQVEILVAFEISRQAPVRKSLCDSLEVMARERGCQHIVFTMAARSHGEPGSAPRVSWEQLGTRMETVEFVKSLDSASEDKVDGQYN
jgi:hypothetical protein